MFDDIRAGWLNGGPMLHEKMELEHVYFCGRYFFSNNHGFNPNVGIVYPKVARERARRPTSNVPTNQGPASLQVVGKRVSLLLNKPDDVTLLVLHTFERM